MSALRRIRFLESSLLRPTNARPRRPCTTWLTLIVLAAGCAGRGGAEGGDVRDETVILLMRHAERASEDANADLSDAGQARAADLARVAGRYGVRVVYTTDLCRTAQTGQPAAAAAGAPLHIMATGSGAAGLDTCTPRITVGRETAGGTDAAAAAARILELHRGSVVLVVGHSNTVPALIEAFTGASPCPARIPLDERQRCFLPESAYGDLFVVRVPAGGPVRVDAERVGS